MPISLTPDGAAIGTLDLDPDGKARLEGVPVGAVRTVEGIPCLEWDGGSTYSGNAEWKQLNKSYLVVKTLDGDAVLGAYLPPNSDVVWYKFGIPVCEGETMWYWSSEQ